MQVLLCHGKPMIERDENFISILNEIMVSIYLIVSTSLTGHQGPNPKQAECGMALVAIILLTFAVNLIKFLLFATKKIVHRICLRR